MPQHAAATKHVLLAMVMDIEFLQFLKIKVEFIQLFFLDKIRCNTSYSISIDCLSESLSLKYSHIAFSTSCEKRERYALDNDLGRLLIPPKQIMPSLSISGKKTHIYLLVVNI